MSYEKPSYTEELDVDIVTPMPVAIIAVVVIVALVVFRSCS